MAKENAVEAKQAVMLTYAEAVAATIADNGKEFKNVHVTRASYAKREEDGHEIITLTTDTPLARYVADPENPDVFTKQMSRTFVVSLFSFVAVMSQMEDAQVLAGRIAKKPVLIESLIPGSTISIVQREVKADTPFTNFFNGREATLEHDAIVTDVTKIELSKFAVELLSDYRKSLAAQLMGDL